MSTLIRAALRVALLAFGVLLLSHCGRSPSTPSNCNGDCFPNGVAAGDVDQSSVVLWAKADFAGTVSFEYGRDPSFLGTPDGVQDKVVTDQEIPVKVLITGLLPGTQYYYRACRDTCQSAAEQQSEARGGFRTPHANGNRGLRFGVSSCWRYDMKPFVSMKNVPERNLDFFVALGDTVYADSNAGKQERPESDRPDLYLDRFRGANERIYSQLKSPDDNMFALARASTAFYVAIDDHEVVNDFAGGAHPRSQVHTPECMGSPVSLLGGAKPWNVCFCDDDLTPGKPDKNCAKEFINETDLFKHALQAWHEWNPIREEKYGNTGDLRTAGKARLYRHRTFGTDAALFMLDTRSFRDDPIRHVPGITLPDLDKFDPTRTMLGSVQLDELLKDLQDAESNGITWKFVLVPEPIQELGIANAADRFEGYGYERGKILDFVQTKCIANVVFVSGDIHGSIVNNLVYKRNTIDLQKFSASWDISTGPAAYSEPLGFQITGSEPGGDREFNDAIFQVTMDSQLRLLNNPQTGFQQEHFLPKPVQEFNSDFPVTLDPEHSSYVAAHSYGWTEFEIDPATQKLLVTTYGIDWYRPPNNNKEAIGLLGRNPIIVSRFEISPRSGCTGRPNGELCLADDWCQSRLCNAGTCTLPQANGSVCVRDEGCQSGLCNAGICTSPQANGSICVRDEGCQSGLCIAGICSLPQANGSFCTNNADCKSKLCDLGFCTQPFSKGWLALCFTDKACRSGDCSVGVCTRP